MPTWTVQLRINVPTLGERLVLFPGIVAPTMAAAADQAKLSVVVEAMQAQQTAATP